MKKIEYTVLDPGGNVTALIKTDVPKKERAIIANRFLRKDLFKSVGVEQVGFIRLGIRVVDLKMANGELCVNATRCAGAFTAQKTGTTSFNLKTSGLNSPVQIDAEALVDNTYLVKVWFDLNDLVRGLTRENLTINSTFIQCDLVSLSGITHLLTDWQVLPISIKKLFSNQNKGLSNQEIKDFDVLFNQIYQSKPALVIEDAVGFIAYSKLSQNSYRIWPLVKVNGQETIFYETGCGSASLALAYVQNRTGGCRSLSVIQPSDVILKIFVEKLAIEIKGKVQILYEGTTKI